MIAIVVLCTALAEPKWITMQGGGCKIDNKPMEHLGTYQFFYPGKFLSLEKNVDNGKITNWVYQFGPNSNDKMENCVNYRAVFLMKTLIAFCFLAIVSSLSAFILDLTGPQNRIIKMTRRNAIPSIITVILTVIINIFCYWLTTEVELLQNDTKMFVGSKVVVDFDISFYLVTASGGLSIIATAFNCLRRYPLQEESSSQTEPLLDDTDALEPFGLPPGPPIIEGAPMFNIPPPPAYTP